MLKRSDIAKAVAKRWSTGTPPADGDQWHTNHEDCPAGEDTRSRFYIKRKGAVYLGYCHNCSEGGVYVTSIVNSSALSAKQEAAGHVELEPRPSRGTLALLDYAPMDRTPIIPAHVFVSYLFKYMTDTRTAEKWGFQWSESQLRIYMPVFDQDTSGPVRILMRHINPEVKPKVLSYKEPLWVGGALLKTSHAGGSTTVVIVEDWISALLIRDLGYNAYCLFGCHLHQEDMMRVLPYENIVVMMDNDKAGLEASKEICQRLELFKPGGVWNMSPLVLEGKSPKDFFHLHPDRMEAVRILIKSSLSGKKIMEAYSA
jgi:hypothetical protein